MKRTFIAIDIPLNDHVSKILDEFRNDLGKERIKWVDPGQYHITLQFLGDIDDSLINSVNRSLHKISGRCSGFCLKLKEFGVFGNPANPRVLWMGLVQSKELEILGNAVDEEMRMLGFKKPDKPFSPHLTIGRIKFLKGRRVLKEWIDKYRYTEFQEINVREIILYESILKSAGPEYIAIKRHSLK